MICDPVVVVQGGEEAAYYLRFWNDSMSPSGSVSVKIGDEQYTVQGTLVTTAKKYTLNEIGDSLKLLASGRSGEGFEFSFQDEDTIMVHFGKMSG